MLLILSFRRADPLQYVRKRKKYTQRQENNLQICTIFIDKCWKQCYSEFCKKHKGVPYGFLFGMGMPNI